MGTSLRHVIREARCLRFTFHYLLFTIYYLLCFIIYFYYLLFTFIYYLLFTFTIYYLRPFIMTDVHDKKMSSFTQLEIMHFSFVTGKMLYEISNRVQYV